MTRKNIDEMHFQRLTLVYGEHDGKRYAPVNPEASVLATKANEIVQGVKSFLGLAVKADPSLDESIEVALQQSARSQFYGALCTFEDAMRGVMAAPGFTTEARQAAVDALIEEYGPMFAGLIGMVYVEKCAELETAVKAGARHSKADLASIQTAHASLANAKDAIDRAHAATSALLAQPGDTSADEDAAGGEKAAVVPDQEGTVPDPQTPPLTLAAITAAFAEAVKALTPTLAPPAPVPSNDEAIKAAVDAAIATARMEDEQARKAIADELAAANRRADLATTALTDALGEARARRALGGHEVEPARKAGLDDTEAAAVVKNNPRMTIAQAVSTICSGIAPT